MTLQQVKTIFNFAALDRVKVESNPSVKKAIIAEVKKTMVEALGTTYPKEEIDIFFRKLLSLKVASEVVATVKAV